MFNSKAIKTLFLFSLSSAAFAAPSNNAVSHFKAIGAGCSTGSTARSAIPSPAKWTGNNYYM